jgi:uncharacterized protein (TIGR00106 family)
LPLLFLETVCLLSYQHSSTKKDRLMIVSFSVIPMGSSPSVGDKIAEILKIVDSSGLPYKINPMGTVVEGEWDDIMKLIKKCHKTTMKSVERTITTISIDDRKGKTRRIDEKVTSVERRIGRTLKK